MTTSDEADFIAYVTGRLPVLRRVAANLAGDPHRGDDLVQQAITRLYTHWRRASRTENLNAYVYKILLRTFLDERRLRWASVRLRAGPVDSDSRDSPPQAARAHDPTTDVADRLLLREALGTLPPKQRAIGSPVPARPSLPTWQQFDPLALEIDASDIPGYALRVSTSSTNWQRVALEKEVGTSGSRGITVYVVQYACGGEPWSYDADGGRLMSLDPSLGEPADPIGGAPAYWLPPGGLLPDGWPSVGLAWRWTAGAWVVVYAQPASEPSTVDPMALRSAAAEVAPQLELGVGTPVTSPISLPPPHGTYPSVTATSWVGDAGELFAANFMIGFDNLGKAAPAQPFDYTPSFTVLASAFWSPDDLPDGATEYPEDLGYPAFQAVWPYGDRDVLLVYDVLGFGLAIEPVEVPGASTQAERLSVAADVFRTITVYPDADDGEEKWGDPIAL